MSERRRHTPGESAQITANMRTAFAFMQDLIDDPASMALIPDNSTITVRDVRVQGDRFRLAAYRPSESNGPWSSRVTSYLSVNGNPDPAGVDRPPFETRSADRTSRLLAPSVWEIVSQGPTADAAFERLEALLARLILSPQNPVRPRGG